MFDTITAFEYKDFAFRDTGKTIAIAIAILLATYLTLSWISTNVTGQTAVVFVYFSLLILFAGAYMANILKSRIKALEPLPFGTVGVGWNIPTVAILSLVGIGIGWYLVAQQFTISLPLDVTFKQSVLGMDYIYKVYMSPFIEEFFRAVVLITTALIVWKFSRNWLLALLAGLLISSFAFGIFHWLAYQQSFAFIGSAVIFGLIAGTLMLASKSVVPSIALHYVNNQLVFSKGEPTEIIILTALVIAVLGITLFRRFKK